MRLTLTDPWDPGQRVSTKGIKEEGVETLILANLATIFPGWRLRLGAKSLWDWAGADISATDPTGCVHLFEVKYGADEENVVDQGLAYALDLLRNPRLRLPKKPTIRG